MLIRKICFIADYINPILVKAKMKGISATFVRTLIYIREFLDTEPELIFDIGAYIGKFTKAVAYLFPKAEIYSFEPLLCNYKKMRSLLRKYKNIHLVNCALSEINGEIEFFENKYTASSSYKKMLERHKIEFPHTDKEKIAKVSSKRLDFFKGIIIKHPFLVKIDTQGSELDIIKSGETIIKSADVLLIEVSIVKLYEDSPSFFELCSELNDLGFTFYDKIGESRSKRTGRIVQCDILFVKKSLL